MAEYTSLINSLRIPEATKKNVSLVVDALRDEGILTPRVLAYTLATIGHESNFGQSMMEIGAAQQAARYGYQGGAKYAGRGFVQLTGFDNYRRYGEMLGIDLVNNPEKAAEPEIAAKIAALFMKYSGTAAMAERGDFVGARSGVNPGEFNLPANHPQTKNPRAIANVAQSYLNDLNKITPQDWQKMQMPRIEEEPRKPLLPPKPIETKETTTESAKLKPTFEQLTKAIEASPSATRTPQPTVQPTPAPTATPTPQPTPMQQQMMQPNIATQSARFTPIPPPVTMPATTATVGSAATPTRFTPATPTYTPARFTPAATNYVTVKPGQTLWSIAQQYLGSGAKWKELGFKGSPTQLPVGYKIPVPSIAGR